MFALAVTAGIEQVGLFSRDRIDASEVGSLVAVAERARIGEISGGRFAAAYLVHPAAKGTL